MTEHRAQELIDRMTDEALVAFATTCSNRGVRLDAEMQLRKRYPSRKVARKLTTAQAANRKCV